MFNQTQPQPGQPTIAAVSTPSQAHSSEWVRLPKAGQRLEGCGRSTLYELIKLGLIRSKVLKTHKHAQKGIRLIHVGSLREYIASGEETQH